MTTIFSLLSVFTATLAWFNSNNSTRATGMSVTVAAKHVSLENVSLYKFNYGTAVYETFTVIDYLDPNLGNVGKYDYDSDTGTYLDTESNAAVKMNIYDPMQSIVLGSTLYDLHSNIVLKVDIESSMASAIMDLNAFKITGKTKETNQIFLSDCVDFDVFFQSDLDAVTNKADYYPSYIPTSDVLTDEQTVYYKISYLSSEASTHSNFYSANPSPNTLPILEDENIAFTNNKFSIYININYSPNQLHSYSSEIYARNIDAIYDFNFEFVF